MCLGIPGRIVEIVDAEKQLGRVDVLGTIRTISLVLLAPEAMQVGTWVLTNADMAISQIEADQASQLLQLIEELERRSEEEQV